MSALLVCSDPQTTEPRTLCCSPRTDPSNRRQRDVLALTLRGRRLAALGPEASAAVDDYPEETKAQQASQVKPGRCGYR